MDSFVSERFCDAFFISLLCVGYSTHKTGSNLSEKPIFYATLYAYMERNKKFIKKTNSCTAYGIVLHTYMDTHTKNVTQFANDKMPLDRTQKKAREKFFRVFSQDEQKFY